MFDKEGSQLSIRLKMLAHMLVTHIPKVDKKTCPELMLTV